MKELKLTVETDTPVTLQNFLIGEKGVSKRLLTKLKRIDGGITRDGKTASLNPIPTLMFPLYTKATG